MTGALERYRTTGHEFVEGWLAQGAIEATCALSALQRSRGIKGPVCEIGVHHGRLFILLHLLSQGRERSVAIDLFEMQDENVDGSGKGSRDHLMHNLRAHGCDLERIDLIAENSLRVTPARIAALCGGRPRLFSIDGGHTAQVTRNDLRLANASVCEGGVVILDDFFNSSWPAVSEGACAFMHEDGGQLLPVGITSNKFFFARGEDAAAAYRRHLLAGNPGATMSRVFEQDVVCFEPAQRPTLRHIVTSHPRWLKIRQTPVGQALRGLKRWM